MKTTVLVFLAVLCLGVLRAAVRPGVPFQDHAVLQQGRPVPVWGTAAAGETITVTYRCGAIMRSASAVADDDGRWRAALPALTASAEAGTLTISGREEIMLSDILVGEVWLASGQSNMEWPVGKSADAGMEIAAATHPAIRHLKISRVTSDEPRDEVRGEWTVCSPGKVGAFSAVGYFFARELHSSLGVPVGIIDATWGGTPIEPWMRAEALASDPSFAAAWEGWGKRVAAWAEEKPKHEAELAAWIEAQNAAAARGEPFDRPRPQPRGFPYPQHRPTALYNGMIHPLAPAALRGVIWYQGEANVGRADGYRKRFPALITDWRTVFEQKEMPFYWVQLANFANGGRPNGTEYAELREAQQAALALPGTGQAIAIDVGEAATIHPRNKQEVGRRLALLALRRSYGKSTLVDTGPLFAEVQLGVGPPDRIRIRFSDVADGLVNSAEGSAVLGFEVAGADKRFQAAEARIENAGAGTVLITAPASVPTPVHVRYAWRNDPPNSLVNSEGLPAAPFRTDR